MVGRAYSQTFVASGQAKVSPQGVIYELMGLAFGGDNLVELCGGSVRYRSPWPQRGNAAYTPSQNCCSLSREYETSNSIAGLKSDYYRVCMVYESLTRRGRQISGARIEHEMNCHL